jgi:branched-chain amino acid aminotransferase
MADNVIQAIEHPNVTSVDWSSGAAYIDGAIMPLHEAKIPVTDWGYRRSDVTYDVVGVYFGAFFRLEDHLRRFRASMDKLRLKPRESDREIAGILADLVRRAGLREAYVAMDCLRGRPPAGAPYHPAFSRNYLLCFALPWGLGVLARAAGARGACDHRRDAPNTARIGRGFEAPD